MISSSINVKVQSISFTNYPSYKNSIYGYQSFQGEQHTPANISFTRNLDLKEIERRIPGTLEKLNTDNYPDKMPKELCHIPLHVITVSKKAWIDNKVPPIKYFRHYPALLDFAKKHSLPIAHMDLVIPDARYIRLRKRCLEEKPVKLKSASIEKIAEAYYNSINTVPSNPKGQQGKIIALIGAAGSGKSSLINHIKSREGELMTPDADEIKKLLIERLHLDPCNPISYIRVHKASYEISDRVILRAIKENKNILIQTTGKWSEFPTWLARLGKEAKRKVHMYFNRVSAEVATERSWQREQQIGRGYDPIHTELTGLAPLLNFYTGAINNKVDYWEVLSTGKRYGFEVSSIVNSDNVTPETLHGIKYLIRNKECRFQAKDHEMFTNGALDYDTYISECRSA